MNSTRYKRKLAVAASEFKRERDYWLKKLSGELLKSCFPYDYGEAESGEFKIGSLRFTFPEELCKKLVQLSSGSDIRLHIILVAGLSVLLYRYTNHPDILVGTPIYKQEADGQFVNTVLVLRNRLTPVMIFKDFLTKVKETLIEAVENQNYPIEVLVEKLNIQSAKNGFPLFDIVIMLENIHDKQYIQHVHPNITLSCSRADSVIEGVVEYNTSLYNQHTVDGITNHFKQCLQNALADVSQIVVDIDILTETEKKRLLDDFNKTEAVHKRETTIKEQVERQVEKTPDRIAAVGVDGEGVVSYQAMNNRANRLAGILRRKGVARETVVGFMTDRSHDIPVGLLAILKAGGAYLPILPETPPERTLYMLNDAYARVLLSQNRCIQSIPFSSLQELKTHRQVQISVTPPRHHIEAFGELSMPDRSLINLKKYKSKIGMASVTDCISLQATRGCPYECLFCHKIWSKHHVYRSVDNIYGEIEYYYKQGVRNFAFIDDCFNLDRQKSSGVFECIIKNGIDVQLFFPNGLRGDIMTPDYIDLMAKAGTRGINLSLETASPRLQKLIKKNLNLEKFKEVVDYIALQHPEIILEMATMHGLPSETEEEAMMTLDFVKSIRWLHFPYIHILKIFPNTDMEKFALEQGISREDIMKSKGLAFHELPETLPFPKSFTRQYQAEFMNEYFLDKERLRHVLPVQMKVLSEEALCQKYNAYLPIQIDHIEDIINFTGLEDIDISGDNGFAREVQACIFDRESVINEAESVSKKILFLDLSQHFSTHSMLYRVVEQPLGLIYLLTYLKQRFGDQVDGRIYKSGVDFDSFSELKVLVDEYQPDLVGIRTLTFFKEFFHETVALLRQWGVTVPIITGGPYASSDFDTILKDPNVNLVVIGEGELTLAELIDKMLAGGEFPGNNILREIKGIAFRTERSTGEKSREIVFIDRMYDRFANDYCENTETNVCGENLAYVMYTSGSTGRPKGVMVEHRQVNNCIDWMQRKFDLTERNMIVQRTNLTFDPSVWEIFWPLYVGASTRIISALQSKDAEYLIDLMARDPLITVMYCPSTLVTVMTHLIEAEADKEKLRLPRLIIGAESIMMDTVRTFYHYYEGRITNTYGPTECAINNTYYDLERDDGRDFVPIGRPVDNNRIYILSEDLHLLPLNIPGEIFIAGDSVARGYINNIPRTSAQFISSQFGESILYKTGDIGRWLQDGNIELTGRTDEQVKIRGYRIEPREIENILLKHEMVKECVVLVRENKSDQGKVKICKRCGISSHYPGVKISESGLCEICLNFDKHKGKLDNYFKALSDLEKIIRDENRGHTNRYDCLLLFSGGRGSAFALYQLVDMGFRVLAVTYDNGYFGKADLQHIKRITSSLEVDHIVFKHKNSDQILKESLKSASTVCRGCFHTSFSLAAEYAYNHGIKAVIGATLSRGQIIENKLFGFLQQGITGTEQLEDEILKLQKMAPAIDVNIFKNINIDVVNDGAIYQTVKFLDFFRYCDIPNSEMISFLHRRDSLWKTRKNYSIYSTNCPIKQIGDYAHLQSKGYHYYGSATSWEKRLGHLTLKNLGEDLNCRVSAKGYENFSKRIGFREDKKIQKDDKYICAYFVGDKLENDEGITISELRKYLQNNLPEYMVPAYFIELDEIPLGVNGKIDKAALPKPVVDRSQGGATYVAPKTDMEKSIAQSWKDILKVDDVGVHDNFFELGGNSLDIIMLSSKLKEMLGNNISVVTLFTYPTINSLADYLAKDKGEKRTLEKEVERSEMINKGKGRLRESLQKRRRTF